MNVRAAISAVALAILVLVGGAATYRSAFPARPGGGGLAPGEMSLAQARAAEFPVYYGGDFTAELPLRVVLRGENSGPVDDIDFVYGDCRATPEQGCAPPVEVQIWPACVRNPTMYAPSGPSPLPRPLVPVQATVRGVPGAFFEDFHRLELQSGISTIVIFGRGYDDLLRIAQGLRGLNVDVGPRVALPPPSPAALAGKLSCAGLT
jgi:hypothetical protein